MRCLCMIDYEDSKNNMITGAVLLEDCGENSIVISYGNNDIRDDGQDNILQNLKCKIILSDKSEILIDSMEDSPTSFSIPCETFYNKAEYEIELVEENSKHVTVCFETLEQLTPSDDIQVGLDLDLMKFTITKTPKKQIELMDQDLQKLTNITAEISSGKIGCWSFDENGLTTTSEVPDKENVLRTVTLNKANLSFSYKNLDSLYEDEFSIGYNPELKKYYIGNPVRTGHDQILYGTWSVEKDFYANRTLSVDDELYVNGNIYANQNLNITNHLNVNGGCIFNDVTTNILNAENINCNDTVEASEYVLGAGKIAMADINLMDFNVKSGSYSNSLQFIQNKSNDQGIIRPSKTDKLQLGQASYKWTAVYAGNTNIQSDLKRKNSIQNIENAEAIVMGLKPKQYLMNNGTSGRTHYGFIAQDVSELADKLGVNMSLVKASHVTHDENGNPIDNYYNGDKSISDENLEWTLDYNELIAPIVNVIQHQQQEIEQLKQMIILLMK